MATFITHRMLNSMASSSRVARRQAPARRRRRGPLLVEQLESRWVPTMVTTLADAGPGSLRQAILDTPSGGTVDFQPGMSGTITLTTGYLLIDRNLTIAGPGAIVLTVSGNNASRVFIIPSMFTVTISGLTIANGTATGYSPSGVVGGGIINSGTLTVVNSTLSGNRAIGLTSPPPFPRPSPAYGGGIYNAGTLTVITSTLSGNAASSSGAISEGGGIYNGGGLTVINSTLSGNFGAGGGGIFNAGTATVTGSTLSQNTSSNGGGIYNGGTLSVITSTLSGNAVASVGTGGGIFNGGGLSVINSTLSGNSAQAHGGGIFNARTATVAGSTLSGNTANYGGGISNGGTLAALTVTNSTLSGNAALSGFYPADGGGIHNTYWSTLTVTNSTLSGNSAAATGGGIFSEAGTALRNALVAGNTAPFFPDVNGLLWSYGYNLIGDSTGGSGFVPTDLLNVNPQLGSLQDNGGPTLTHALLPGSPALDAGDPSYDPAGGDQRGQGFPRISGSRMDIGAFEFQQPRRRLPPPDFDLASLLLSSRPYTSADTPRINTEGERDQAVSENRPATTTAEPASATPARSRHQTESDIGSWLPELLADRYTPLF